MHVNKYIMALRPYPVSSHAAWEQKSDANVLKLDWNESTIGPSPNVVNKLQDFLQNGNLNWYPDTNNIELRKSIAKYSQLPVENVQYFASSDSIHEYVVRTFLSPLDKVLVVGPTYDNFRAVAESNGSLVDYYNLNSDFTISYDDFKSHIEQYQPKIVYICNPNNPTGTIHPVEILNEIISQFPEVLFLIDEAYFEFTNNTCSQFVKKYNNIIITRTFSKAFGLASFRIGYCLSSIENIGYLTKIRNPKSISMISQVAALAALNDLRYTQSYVDEVNTSKKIATHVLKELGLSIFYQGGNYILINLAIGVEKELLELLLKKNIYIRSYSHVNGAHNSVRMTIGTKEQMVPVLEVFKDFFKK